MCACVQGILTAFSTTDNQRFLAEHGATFTRAQGEIIAFGHYKLFSAWWALNL